MATAAGKGKATSRGPIASLKLPPQLRAVPEPDGEDATPAQSAVGAVPPVAPAKPNNLPKDVAAAWDRIVPELTNAGLVGPTDALTIELALRHFVAARKASNALGREPVTIEDRKNGRKAKHPASQVFRDHSEAFLKYATQLGMSFAARARLPMPGEDEGDADNEFAS